MPILKIMKRKSMMRSIAFPYAGGSMMMYSRWKSDLLDIYPIDYSGHGVRFAERLAKDFKSLVEDAYNLTKVEIGKWDEFVLMGHSMGGLVAWYVTERLLEEHNRRPKAIIVSGTLPPEWYPTEKLKSLCEDECLQKYIEEYNRIPSKKRNTKVYMDYIYPAIKNDFEIISKYENFSKKRRIDIPLLVFYSHEDSLIGCEHIGEWEKYSTNCTFYEMNGDHFYIEDEEQREKMMKIIERNLSI